MATRKRDVATLARVPPPKLEQKLLDEQHVGPDSESDSNSSSAPERRHRSATADRWRRIAVAAYLRAERRGFAGRAELEDWLEAEKEVDAELMKQLTGDGPQHGT
jgi:Protein of unknown function (DUF2934)